MNPVMKVRGVSYSPVSKYSSVLHPTAPRRQPWARFRSASDLHEALGSRPAGDVSLHGDYDYWGLSRAGLSCPGPSPFRGSRPNRPHPLRSRPDWPRLVVLPGELHNLSDSPPRLRGPLPLRRHLHRAWRRALRAGPAVRTGVGCHRPSPPNGDALPARGSRTVPATVSSSPRIVTRPGRYR